MTQGSCLCGTVAYEVDGPFSQMLSCHCSMCRKHHGAGFATFVAAPSSGFRWLGGEEAIGSYQSSAAGKRYFCTVCGSVAPMIIAQYGVALCPAGNLDGELGIKPQGHIFVGSKAPWYTITDRLPQHQEYPPEFAAPSVPRPQVEPKPGITQGSCLCGDVAFEAADEPMFMWSCHCRRCRKARSAAHGTNVFFRFDQFRWIRGESQLADYKLPDARYFGTAFCKRCGGEMPRTSRERSIVVIPAGCLDTDPPMRPGAHIFVGSKAPWFDITDDLPQHAELPPQRA